jgi:2-polyprenyl-3-methyl-5-hydroxy-6-metoxy-1,4-benzoquinol methylase
MSNLGSSAQTGADDWESHWQNYGDSNAHNPAQAYRRRLILRALELSRATSPVRLLELGCGHGDFAREIVGAHPGLTFLGVDRAATGVSIARSKVPSAVFAEADLTVPASLPEQYRGFASHAVCSEVLEHVDDPALLLATARALFAPGCRLVITVPAGPISAFDRHIGHRRHFTPAALERVIRDAGLELLSLSGAGFPFFNLYRLTVVARGAGLIRDVAGGQGRDLPFGARAAMRAFSTLFRLNLDHGRYGWQLVAVAGEPGRRS